MTYHEIEKIKPYLESFIENNDRIEILGDCIFIYYNETNLLNKTFNLNVDVTQILKLKYMFMYTEERFIIKANEYGKFLVTGHYAPKKEYGQGYDGVFNIEHITHLWDINYKPFINEIPYSNVRFELEHFINHYRDIVFPKFIEP